MTEGIDGATSALDDVLITTELARRPVRTPDYAGQAKALVALAQVMAASPETVLQKLVDTALALCRAESAGISILEPGGANGVFRWHAIAGLFAPNLAVVTGEFQLCHADGSWRDIEAVGQNFLHDPAIAGVVTHYRNVTERKRAEDALRASEERISKLVALMPAAVYTCDAEGRLTFYNRRAAEL